jgi:hypothetical protein
MIFDVTAGNSDGGVSRLLQARECVAISKDVKCNFLPSLSSFLSPSSVAFAAPVAADTLVAYKAIRSLYQGWGVRSALIV